MNIIAQQDLYLEIGCEEIPCTYITPACEVMQSLFQKVLLENYFITPESTVSIESTPRRICLFVDSARIIQPHRQEIIWGPPEKVLKNEDNTWSNAALKFAQKTNSSCQNFKFGTDPKGRRACFIEQDNLPLNLEQMLPQFLEEILPQIPFPKTMRFWTGDRFSFARPIRWLVALWGDQQLSFSFHNLTSQSFSYGLRKQSGIAKINFSHASKNTILSTYQKAGIDISPTQRTLQIKEEMQQAILSLSEDTIWEQTFDENLLNEVIHLIESGKVLIGKFNPNFCQLPDFVLECVMKHHHKFFPVYSQEGMLPCFISVVNGSPNSDVVLNGNQKVLHARFADAQFFIQEDLKKSLHEYSKKLDSITIHPKIGTFKDKLQFMNHIAREIISHQKESFPCSLEQVLETIKLSKADQLTQMVYEFPELQGKIGAFYARKQNIDEDICLAIEQQYSSPEEVSLALSQILILCDQISLLIPALKYQLKVTGSKDPYGVRRASITLIKTILSNPIWNLDCKELFYAVTQDELLSTQCITFCKERLTAFFHKDLKIPHNIIQATTDVNHFNIHQMKLTAQFLHHQYTQNATSLESITEAFIRIDRFLKPEERDTLTYDPSQLEHPQEQKVHQHLTSHFVNNPETILNNTNIESLKELAQKIHQLFLDLQIRSSDHNTTVNRIALLANIHQKVQQYCNWSKLTK